MGTEINELDVYYTWDNSFPDNHYPKYTSQLMILKDAFELRVITYRDGKPIGMLLPIPVTELKKGRERNKSKLINYENRVISNINGK